MRKPGLGKASLSSLKSSKVKHVSMSTDTLVDVSPLCGEKPLPLRVSPKIEGVNLIKWCKNNKSFIDKRLLEHGGILFRGFPALKVGEFESLVATVSGELLRYTYQSTPRSEVEGRIYTSTEYPADQSIPMHNEMSYSRSWPMKIWFFCMTAAKEGGETPIADSHRVYERIDPEVRETFERKKVMYVRNYGEKMDLPWQDVFQTEERSQVEAFCQKAGLAMEWTGKHGLKTSQVCQATVDHPVTGKRIWFNQAHLFHISSLHPEVRESLLSSVAEEELPRNTYYGDGTPIEEEFLDHIRKVYEEEMVTFEWEAGDILLLDNVLTAHGRRPFVGPRKVLVGMAEPYTDPAGA